MSNAAIIDQNYISCLKLNTVLCEKDPIRSFKKGSLVKLSALDLSNHTERSIANESNRIPYWDSPDELSPARHIEMRNAYSREKWPKNITFLVLSDLETNSQKIHGWITISYGDDHVEMAKGWFNYCMLVMCIDFSEEDSFE